ncbi:MAG: response regulator [Bacteroidota bacterium]
MSNKNKSSIASVKELTSEHLRAADKLVRLKRYDEALHEIESAYKIDPKNMYTRAYIERTRYIIDKENEKRSQVFGEIDMTGERRMEALSQLFASAEAFISENKYHDAMNALEKIFQLDPKNYQAKAFSDRIRVLMQNEAADKKIKKTQLPIDGASEPEAPLVAKLAADVQHEALIQPANIPPPESTPNDEPQEEVGRFALYRELLKECWADGVITPEESDMLHRVRSQYSISFDTHCRIEVDIKIDAYVDALRNVWLDDIMNDNGQEVLEIMRKKFGITQEEKTAALEKFYALHIKKESKALILIVDNDYHNLVCLARAFINHSYDVKVERHPDDALRSLSTYTPDLILSEAVFPDLETDGFEFFQKIRSDNRLSQIPYLMMTCPDDARIVRAGLRMGVDYFISKPLHIGNTVAIVEGKLKSGLQTTIQKQAIRCVEKQRMRTLL